MTDAHIKPILISDIDEIIHHCITAFHGNGMTDAAIATFTNEATDWSISKKLVTDRIVGFYLLHEASVADWATTRFTWAWAHDCGDIYAHCKVMEDLAPYHGQRGVEGIALVVLPEYQRLGYGAQLRSVPQAMGYQHIYGEHFKSANNLPYWLKTRRLIAECDGIWVTLQDLAP